MTAVWRLVIVLVGLGWAQSAHALCTLLCTCTVSTTPVVFSAHNPLAAPNNDSSGSVLVQCGGTAGLLIPYTVAMGVGGGTSISARSMSSGTGRLFYNVYTTNSRTVVLGDGTGGSAVLNGSVTLDVLGTAPPQNWTIYGRIPGGQTGVAPGAYSDTLVVTVTYQ